MSSSTRVPRRLIGAIMCLWLTFATILSLPYQIAAILPPAAYHWVKDRFGSVVVLLKELRYFLIKFTN
jgi:hypothetical protein